MAKEDKAQRDPPENQQRFLVSANNEEIIRLAKEMWLDPEVRNIFERVGYDRDLTDTEEIRIKATIMSLTGIDPLLDYGRRHLLLAPCLLRRLASGMIQKLDSADAHDFLDENKPLRSPGGSGERPTKGTPEEVRRYAREVLKNEQITKILEDKLGTGIVTDLQSDTIDIHKNKHIRKFGLLNRNGAVFNFGFIVAERILNGEYRSVDDPLIDQFLEKFPDIIRF